VSDARDDAMPLLVEMNHGTAWVTLNRPDSLNAMNVELMDALRRNLSDLARDQATRCVVLRGAGRSFCAGGDIAEIKRRQPDDSGAPIGGRLEEHARTLVHHAESAVLLRTMPKPTVALLHGHVFGGGVSLALAADLRLAADSTKMRMGFPARSLSGDFGIAYSLTHAVGSAKARELMLLDPELDAAEAHRLGLVTSVCNSSELDEAGKSLADKLAAGPTIALGRLKDNIAAAETMQLADVIRLEALNGRISILTYDAQEAGRAFAERRPPEFEGR
jgi:2-(1,2-epoxy-1,2-dihydrophenyl)acetyl-CoA isomerase